VGQKTEPPTVSLKTVLQCVPTKLILSDLSVTHVVPGALKMREWKMQEWKLQEKTAAVEIAGVEEAGVDRTGGICRSGKSRSR